MADNGRIKYRPLLVFTLYHYIIKDFEYLALLSLSLQKANLPTLMNSERTGTWCLISIINTNAGRSYTEFSFKFKHSQWFTNQGKILFFPLQGTCVSNWYLDSMKTHWNACVYICSIIWLFSAAWKMSASSIFSFRFLLAFPSLCTNISVVHSQFSPKLVVSCVPVDYSRWIDHELSLFLSWI